MALNAASAFFNPQVLARMIGAGFANIPILYGSGAVDVDPTMPYGKEYLGLTINIPYSSPPVAWQVLADGVAGTPAAFSIGNAAGTNTTPETETVLRAYWGLDMTSWARSNPLDPYGEARRQGLEGFAQILETQLIAKACDNTAGIWAAYINDVSTSSDPLLSHDAVVDAKTLLGSEGYNDDFVLGAVHSHTIGTLWKRKDSTGRPWLVENPGEVTAGGARIYRLAPLGIPILVSDLMPVSIGTGPGGANVYTSAFFRRGALALYLNPNLSARSVQEPNTDSQLDGLNCYFTAHRRKKLQNRAKPGTALVTHQ